MKKKYNCAEILRITPSVKGLDINSDTLVINIIIFIYWIYTIQKISFTFNCFVSLHVQIEIMQTCKQSHSADYAHKRAA